MKGSVRLKGYRAWPLVFLSCTSIDILFVMYMHAVASQSGLLAGAYSALVFLVGAFTVLMYVDDHRLLIPALVGNFVGPLLAVELFL